MYRFVNIIAFNFSLFSVVVERLLQLLHYAMVGKGRFIDIRISGFFWRRDKIQIGMPPRPQCHHCKIETIKKEAEASFSNYTVIQ